MKCQHCVKVATLHITEVESEEHCEVLHFCSECGRKYLTEPQAGSQVAEEAEAVEEDSLLEPNPPPCEHCGINFIEFRNSGRLGCEHDYDAFREELIPLLESIHGDVRHMGKLPNRKPAQANDLHTLRKQLQRAIHDEDYEQAASLRDQIRRAEQGL